MSEKESNSIPEAKTRTASRLYLEDDEAFANRIAKAYKWNSKSVFPNGKADVIDFQKQWNTNNPKDRITEDGVLGVQTLGRYKEKKKREAMQEIKSKEETERLKNIQEAEEYIKKLVIVSTIDTTEKENFLKNIQIKIDNIKDYITSIREHPENRNSDDYEKSLKNIENEILKLQYEVDMMEVHVPLMKNDCNILRNNILEVYKSAVKVYKLAIKKLQNKQVFS
jgi:hypothetical protein